MAAAQAMSFTSFAIVTRLRCRFPSRRGDERVQVLRIQRHRVQPRGEAVVHHHAGLQQRAAAVLLASRYPAKTPFLFSFKSLLTPLICSRWCALVPLQISSPFITSWRTVVATAAHAQLLATEQRSPPLFSTFRWEHRLASPSSRFPKCVLCQRVDDLATRGRVRRPVKLKIFQTQGFSVNWCGVQLYVQQVTFKHATKVKVWLMRCQLEFTDEIIGHVETSITFKGSILPPLDIFQCGSWTPWKNCSLTS